MKLALHHNYLDNIGGAERVTFILARELQADIYTTNKNKKNNNKQSNKLPITSIGTVSKQAPFRQQLALLRFRLFQTKKHYDVHIIAGDWAVSAAKRNKPSLWYVHSPIRELWDLRMFTRTHIVAKWQRPLFDLWTAINKTVIYAYAQEPTKIVCNSKTVQERIKRYLHRDAKVIYPPVDTNSFYYKRNGNFWLSVNRLTPHKRIQLQIEAFRHLPNERLVIVGSYEQSKIFLDTKNKLLKHIPPNVSFLHHVSDEELKELYATCKGALATAKHEDFGLSPVEAMASGKPVIAANEGGYKETIIHGKTGLLIQDITPQKLSEAITLIGNNPQIYREACERQAKKFDTKRFIRDIRAELENISAQQTVEKKAIRTYDDYATTYDAFLTQEKHEVTGNNFIERPCMLKAVGSIRHKKLLDIGCGTGVHLEAYTKKGASCIGVDASASMVKLAKKKNKKTTILQANMTQLPLATNSFDIVTASLTVPHIDKLALAYAEVSRVLKPRGIFFFSDYSDVFSSLEKKTSTTNWEALLGANKQATTKKLIIKGDFFTENKRMTEFIPGCKLPYYRRTTKTHLRALQKANLELIDIIYCKPHQRLQQKNKNAYTMYSKIPQSVIYVARKK